MGELTQAAAALQAEAAAYRAAPPILAPTDASSMKVLKLAGDILARALSIRALLLLALVGAFVLAVTASDMLHLGVLVAYTLLVVLPIVTLELKAQRHAANGLG